MSVLGAFSSSLGKLDEGNLIKKRDYLMVT